MISPAEVNQVALGTYRVEGTEIPMALFGIQENRYAVGMTAEFVSITPEHPPVPCEVRDLDGAFVARQRMFLGKPEDAEYFISNDDAQVRLVQLKKENR